MTVSVVWHPACEWHERGPGRPGPPDRIRAVRGALRAPALVSRVVWSEARPAERAAIERVHPAPYVAVLEQLAARGGGALDPDTSLGSRSFAAALAAAAVATGAVERALAAGGGGTAFGATRPPGHHALAARAMGFCFFNNVVIAARRAQELGRARVLIVDWDVPHGNGTQALVERDPSIRYVSMHQYPWYPGTGAEQERGWATSSTCRARPGCRGRRMCATSSPPWTRRSMGGRRTCCSSPQGSTRWAATRSAASRSRPTTSRRGPPRCANASPRHRSWACSS